jgi:hypothetical protein
MGAIFTVLLNLIVAVERPMILERLVLDCAAIFLIGLTATLLMKARLERRQARAEQLSPRPRTV